MATRGNMMLNSPLSARLAFALIVGAIAAIVCNVHTFRIAQRVSRLPREAAVHRPAARPSKPFQLGPPSSRMATTGVRHDTEPFDGRVVIRGQSPMDRAKSLMKPSEQESKRLYGQLSLARLSERRGQTEQAQHLYAKYREKQPRSPVPYHRLGIIEARAKRYAKAEEYLRKAASLAPPSAELLSDYGYLCYLQNRLDEAEEVLRRAIQKEPENEAANNNLGLVLGEQRRFAESLAAFKRAVPTGAAHSNLAFVLSQMGEPRQALVHYSIALDSKDADLRSAAEAMVQLVERRPDLAQAIGAHPSEPEQPQVQIEQATHSSARPAPRSNAVANTALQLNEPRLTEAPPLRLKSPVKLASDERGAPSRVDTTSDSDTRTRLDAPVRSNAPANTEALAKQSRDARPRVAAVERKVAVPRPQIVAQNAVPPADLPARKTAARNDRPEETPRGSQDPISLIAGQSDNQPPRPARKNGRKLDPPPASTGNAEDPIALMARQSDDNRQPRQTSDPAAQPSTAIAVSQRRPPPTANDPQRATAVAGPRTAAPRPKTLAQNRPNKQQRVATSTRTVDRPKVRPGADRDETPTELVTRESARPPAVATAEPAQPKPSKTKRDPSRAKVPTTSVAKAKSQPSTSQAAPSQTAASQTAASQAASSRAAPNKPARRQLAPSQSVAKDTTPRNVTNKRTKPPSTTASPAADKVTTTRVPASTSTAVSKLNPKPSKREVAIADPATSPRPAPLPQESAVQSVAHTGPQSNASAVPRRAAGSSGRVDSVKRIEVVDPAVARHESTSSRKNVGMFSTLLAEVRSETSNRSTPPKAATPPRERKKIQQAAVRLEAGKQKLVPAVAANVRTATAASQRVTEPAEVRMKWNIGAVSLPKPPAERGVSVKFASGTNADTPKK